MKFTNDQLAKAKEAKSVAELIALAKETGVELAEDEAKKYFDTLNTEGEVADDELDNVAGGCGHYDRPASVTMARAADGAAMCPYCEGPLWTGYPARDPAGDRYDPIGCSKCSVSFRHYWEGDTWTLN